MMMIMIIYSFLYFHTSFQYVSFILNIMTSMGRIDSKIDSKIDLLMHRDLRECLRYCRLIRPKTDDASLIEYKTLSQQFQEQILYLKNSKGVIDYWNMTAFHLFRRIIVDDDLPVTGMPPVHLSTLLASQDENSLRHCG